jgi:serine/threonine-protein phosphatase 6 regulatory ankyrin repeat subunit A/serine/threonine-protein phosphatase 6 regulatory ankyrin repeat subunit B
MKKIILLLILLFISANILFAQEFDLLAEKVIKKDYEGIDDLLSQGININVQQKNGGATVLMVASSYYGYEDCVEYLIGKGADVNLKDNNGKTALLWAASNSFENVKVLISHGAKVNEPANDGITPFIQSTLGVTSGKVPITLCELLLENGADINAELTGRSAAGWTSLHYAAVDGDKELVKFLISNGANVNKATAEGSSALYLAKMGNYDEIVKLLKDAGAKD